jgi:CBS domain containing-hemolysin-like protein
MNNYYLITLLMLAFSAFFSGMEIAFISANKLKIELDKKNRIFSGIVLSRFGNNPSGFISTLLLGNTIALVVYGIAISHILDPWLRMVLPNRFNSAFAILITQTVLSTVIILFLAEFAPKALFRINPNRMLKFFALPVTVMYYVLFPLQYLFVKISELILRVFLGINTNTSKYEFTHADLDHYLREYSVDNTKTEQHSSEIQMFQNVIDFSSTTVRECMIPRNELTCIEEQEPVAHLMEKFVQTGRSKILVYREHIDNMVGYVHSFDLFNKPQQISSIVKPVIIVPESMLAKEILITLINKHKSIAVVVDEFGGTSGMVAMEDLIEEITGEINDEFDDVELTEKVMDENTYLFSGRLEIDYLNEKFDLEIPVKDEYETLAGYIMANLERIPEAQETFLISTFYFTVIKASNNRIDLVELKTNVES